MSRTHSVKADQRLDEAQRRYQLLESEAKSAKELGAAQLKGNKDTIHKLTAENTQLRSAIGEISPGKRPDGVSEEVIKLKNKLNAVKSENARKERLLDQLQSQVLVGGSAREPIEPSEQDKRVRVIENRIDKAMIKFNEAQSIKKTYEGILHRLKEERITFDRQLKELEDQLAGKKKDCEELLLMSHDAMHAKEIAQAELHKFEQAVLEERNQRDREVMEKKLLVQQRLEMNQRTEQASQKAAPVVESKPTVHVQLVTAREPKSDSHEEVAKLNQKIGEYEEAYAKLREVTGVTDVNEIIQKYMTQTETHQRLMTQTQEQEKELDQLQVEFKKSKHQLEDLKFSSASPVRAAIASDSADAIVEDSALRLERNKLRFEKLAKVLVELNAGVSHLHAKLAPLKLEGRGVVEVNQVSEDTIEDILNLCELRIVRLIELVGDKSVSEDALGAANHTKDIRIKLPDSRVEETDFDDIAEAGSVFNRAALKKSSEQFVEKVRKHAPIHT